MSWDLILHEWRSLETHKIFHLFGKRQDLEEFRKKTSWLQELIIWLQGFSKQARQNWSPEDWWGLFVGKIGFWRISIVTFKKTQRWMKHDSAVVTGSSRETGHFCDLGWGSSGFGHRVHSFFLAAFVFLCFLESSIFLLVSFGGFMKYCTSIVTEPDSDLFSIQNCWFSKSVLTFSSI